MAERWKTVGDILHSIELSHAITQVLSDVPASTAYDQPTADVGSYLQRSMELGRRSRSNANRFLFEQVQKLAGPDALERLTVGLSGELGEKLAASPGLEAAFLDALSIRERTGGRDSFIGARHVLVAMLTAPDGAVAAERSRFIASVGAKFTVKAMAPALGGLLRSGLEEGESPEVWDEILRERGLPAAAKAVLVRATTTRSTAPQSPSDTAPATPQGQEPAVTPASPGAPAHALANAADDVRFSPQAEAIARFLNDNPWSVPLADIVGVDSVADALARLIAARNFQPPLAVGIFGPWGSGKSLLMRRMHAGLEDLQADGSSAFHDSIVQISFNAWHYVDTDLWASLAGSIFEELDAYARRADPQGPGLLDQLTTARKLTLDAARGLAATRQAARRAEQAVQAAEAKLAAQQAGFARSLKGLDAAARAMGVAGKKWLAGAPEARAAVQATYGRSLEDMAAIWESPQAAIDSLRKDRLVWTETARQFGRWRTFAAVLIFAGLCALAPYAAPYLAAGGVPLAELIARIQPAAAAFTGLLTAAAAAATAFTRRAMAARDAVVAAMEVYRTAKTNSAGGLAIDLAAERDRLQGARDELERARASLATALGRQAAADVAFAGESPASRLRSFVEARAAADGPYRMRQGLVSTIRRDFRDLAALMNPRADPAERAKRQEADVQWDAALDELSLAVGEGDLTAEEVATLRTKAPAETKPFSRIVLYIDDLDRCPPAKVLEVLQAVHLLLAHSLFVVVVAVDVRWLSGALEKEYPDLLEVAANGGQGKAAALDYLEKIFQLPVWTEAIPAEGAGALVRSSLQDPPSDEDDPGGAARVAGGETPATAVQAAEPGSGGPAAEAVNEQAAVDPPAATVETSGPTPEPLRLEPFEIGYLGSLAERLGASPRRLLRFANTYRVARAGVGEETGAALLAGGYRGFGLLLGLAAAYPREFPAMTGDLAKHAKWSDVQKAWVARVEADGARRAHLASVAGYMTEQGVDIARDVRPYVALAHRFSFTG